MSTPLGRQNCNAGILDNLDELNLTLSATAPTLAAGSSTISPDLGIPVGSTLLVLCKQSSAVGDITIKVDEFLAGVAHDFATPSPKGTLTVTNSTTSQYMRLAFTDATKGSFAVKVTSTVGAVLDDLLFAVLHERTDGEDAVSLGTGQNAVLSSKTGDGSGVVSFAPRADHTGPS